MKYSIVIRTRGLGGEKYQKTLDSINRLSILPSEVIISLPTGAEPPSEKLGYEKFVYGNPGIVAQRITGFENASEKYILFCDDDIQFERNIIEKLYEPIKQGVSDASYPPLEEMLPQGKAKIYTAIALRAVPMPFNRTHHLKIMPSGGYRYKKITPKTEKYLYSQTAPGACFFTSATAFKKINYSEELWIDKLPYAMDDQAMFYKYYLKGFRTVCVTDARIKHLDSGSENPKRIKAAAYGTAFFRKVFFKRFILSVSLEKSHETVIKDKLLFGYSEFMSSFFLYLTSLVSDRGKERRKADKLGKADAREFMESREYLNLPTIKRK